MKTFYLFMMVLIVFLTPVAASADSKNLRIGMNTESIYDSNMLYRPKGSEESDLVTMAGPTVRYQVESNRLRLTVDANPRYLAYAELSELNTWNFTNTNTAAYDVNPYWTARLANVNANDSVSFLTADLIGATGRYNYDTNSLTTAADFNSKRGTTATFSHTVDRISYTLPEAADNDGNSYAVSVTQKLTAPLTALGDMSYQTRHFDIGNETSVILVDAGLRYVPSDRMRHTIKAGFNLVDSDVIDSDAELFFAYEGAYALTRRTILTLTSQKYSSIIDSLNNALNLWQNSVSLSHYLTKLTRVNGSFTYVYADYTGAAGSDNVYKAETFLERALNKKMNLKVGYSYEDKTSDTTLAYDDHKVYVSFSMNL